MAHPDTPSDPLLSDEERGRAWVRAHPEVAHLLVTCQDRAQALARIRQHHRRASPPAGASEAFFAGAEAEALRVDIWDD